MSQLTSLILLTALGLGCARVYEPPAGESWFESQNPLSYMEQEEPDEGLQQDLPSEIEQLSAQDVNLALIASINYQNGFDGELKVDCPSGQAIYKVQSIYSGGQGDRRWYFGCRAFGSGGKENCQLHTGINGYRNPFLFMCPAGRYMAGVRSHHLNSKEDRIWSVKCCSNSNYHTKRCKTSEYINNPQEVIFYQACSTEDVFTGLYSFYATGKNDRRFKIITCEMENS